MIAKADLAVEKLLTLHLQVSIVYKKNIVKHPVFDIIPIFEIPANTLNSLTNAWNGFHSVPLQPKDHHLTTFLTPCGIYYKMVPQGCLASKDVYTRVYYVTIIKIHLYHCFSNFFLKSPSPLEK